MTKPSKSLKSYIQNSDLLKFIWSKTFLRQLFYMFIVVLALGFLVIMWLRIYTNHGQKLEMPDYIDQSIAEASKDAEDKSFSILVIDSIHIIGREGGIIIDQNPPAGSFVKENRKIYVRTTKFRPDIISSGELPILYGNNINQKRRELNQRGINVKIKDYAYDPGAADHILEVWYKDEILFDKNVSRKDVNIEKGGTIEVVLSKDSGGKLDIPDFACYTLAQARFILEQSRLKLGTVEYGDDVENVEEAFIQSQSPAYDPILKINMGDKIDLVLTAEKPDGC